MKRCITVTGPSSMPFSGAPELVPFAYALEDACVGGGGAAKSGCDSDAEAAALRDWRDCDIVWERAVCLGP